MDYIHARSTNGVLKIICYFLFQILGYYLKLLDFLGIKNKANFKPLNLSGGQQQRVAIARALMNDPKIILADEPTGNLDTKTGIGVFNLLTLLSREFKRTIIMVTHNPELAAATDRAIHIRDGAIEKDVINVERH